MATVIDINTKRKQPHLGEIGVAVESFRPHWIRFLRWGHANFRFKRPNPNGFSSTMSGGQFGDNGWKQRDRFGQHTALVGKFDVEAFCNALHISKRDYEMIERIMNKSLKQQGYETVPDKIVDRIFTSMGEPHTYRTLQFYRRGSGQNRKPLRLYPTDHTKLLKKLMV